MTKVVLSVSVDPDILSSLREQAEREDRPLSRIVSKILRDHLSKRTPGK